MYLKRLLPGIFLAAGLVAGIAKAEPTSAALHVTPPKDLIGFSIGDDYHMANYTQIATMWKKWAAESDRLKVVSIGDTEEGRPQLMCIISSPENLKNLEHYRQISVAMGRARIPEEQAARLAKEGKPVVWIDGGLHSSESVNSQQLAELVYQMVSRNDEETLRFLRDVVLLAPIANPDGVEVVANWYMRNPEEKLRTFAGLPRLYNKYIGHDNNRDSLMSNAKETANSNRILFVDWIPQIMYNHHQTGPEGEVVFVPPYRDPFNYNFDALLPIGIERVGFAMIERLTAKGMAGVATRSAAPYSTWWNGGYRNACYWHNQIGILSEIIGSPNPETVSFAPAKQLPEGDWPLPIAPQVWHYRQSVDYDVELDRAILDYASRNGEWLLGNIYRMGRNSIERGSRDTWTVTPKRIAAVWKAVQASDPDFKSPLTFEGMFDPTRNVVTAPPEFYTEVLHDPAFRDPRGYIISPDQDDFPTAVKFINALIKAGVEVSRATAPFQVAGKSYPAGSYVVKTDQAFRPEVMDLFEPQDHPMDFAYPGGPPKAPYDITGWTLVKQMGVAADRVYEGFDGPFEAVGFDLQKPPALALAGAQHPAGWLVSHKINDAFILTNRLLKANCPVYWLTVEQTVEGRGYGTGTLWIPASRESQPIVERAAHELGVPAYGLAQKPGGGAMKLKPIRIGLVDLYGGMMPSGWLRWIFDQYEFPYEVVYPQILDAGGLRSSFDVIVFPSDTYAEGSRTYAAMIEHSVKFNAGTGLAGAGGGHYDPPAESIPEELRSMLGGITVNKTVPPLKIFVREGGTIIAIGSSATAGQAMGLPVRDHLADRGTNGEKHYPTSKFYIPGSVLRAKFDNHDPLAYGMPDSGYVFFDSNPVFDVDSGGPVKPNRVAWFDSKEPLYSGWAVGQNYLDGGQAAVEASVGEGKLVLIGFESTFRATPHGTFKLLFNGLYYGSATFGSP